MQAVVECPTNFTPVNQNRIRLVALFVFILSVLYLVMPHWSIAALLVIDFFFRAFNKGTYSFLGWFSALLVKRFSLPNKPIDSGPKEFAAQLGFFLSDFLFIAAAIGFQTAGICIAGILALFSFLESAFSFCAGCYVYTFYRRIFRNPKSDSILTTQ